MEYFETTFIQVQCIGKSKDFTTFSIGFTKQEHFRYATQTYFLLLKNNPNNLTITLAKPLAESDNTLTQIIKYSEQES